ncbi:hypothetical protein [Halobacillus amylolyticus]|uniref:Uncharacterized protein n=1 Tax=Halobacillus amylolyticus TaxID=2932259 RepID=A0ABY4H6Z5_9BACI|nr:hypothetical protein [Halobacillus amylolyticus]UOR10257.1 hypothetical protein MUO15_11055 [Halobacillus amylolyticus]
MTLYTSKHERLHFNAGTRAFARLSDAPGENLQQMNIALSIFVVNESFWLKKFKLHALFGKAWH